MALEEGQVDTAADGIDYAGISSCLTITCLLDDTHTHVGGHASLMQKGSALESTAVLGAMKALIPSERKVVKVHLAGVISAWNPHYLLEKPYIAANGDKNYAHEIVACDADVASCFGVAESAVTSEDKEGSFRIALTTDPPPPKGETSDLDHATLVQDGWKDSIDESIADDTSLAVDDSIVDSNGTYYKIIEADSSAKTYKLEKFG